MAWRLGLGKKPHLSSIHFFNMNFLSIVHTSLYGCSVICQMYQYTATAKVCLTTFHYYCCRPPSLLLYRCSSNNQILCCLLKRFFLFLWKKERIVLEVATAERNFKKKKKKSIWRRKNCYLSSRNLLQINGIVSWRAAEFIFLFFFFWNKRKFFLASMDGVQSHHSIDLGTHRIAFSQSTTLYCDLLIREYFRWFFS